MFSVELLGTLFGLASAASWGTSDFSGGVASKRSSLFGVVIASQVIGFVLLLALAVIFRETFPGVSSIIWAVLAGLSGLVGLLALYQGLATGRMGIVAPVSAVVSGIIPVLVSTLTEGLPELLRLAGFGLALISVWLVSQTGGGTKITLKDLQLPIIAGFGFGLFFVFIDRMTTEATFYPLAVARVASLTVLLVLSTLRGWRRIPNSASLLFVVLSGVFDAAGNVFFALSAKAGTLAIAAVIAGLYPAVTVILARFILKEEINGQQWVGVGLALVAIMLIAV